MKKQMAFTSDFEHGALYPTARAAREAEFDMLMVRIQTNWPASGGDSAYFRVLAGLLRSGIYPVAADKFIKAADYLREHRLVMTGAMRDPQEDSQ